MARQITVITPENIPLTLEPAGIGTRFGALLIDMLIQVTITFIIILIGAIIGALLKWGGFESVGSVLAIVASFLIWFGYFVFFEALWQGQTPGKRVFGLRVVRDGGYPIDFFSSATRNLVRIADFLPISYAAGALTVFFQPSYKRLGDIVAGTIVIKERHNRSLERLPIKAAGPGNRSDPDNPTESLHSANNSGTCDSSPLRSSAVRNDTGRFGKARIPDHRTTRPPPRHPVSRRHTAALRASGDGNCSARRR